MKRIRITFIIVLSILLTSILLSNVSNAILASDQLEVGAGSFVEGKLFQSTTGAADVLMAYITITAEKIFTPTDISDKLIQFQIIIKPFEGYGYGPLENVTENRLTHVVFYDNRTTLMLGEFYVENATEWIEMTVLHESKLADMQNPDNRRISFSNGSSYLAGSLELADPKYVLLESFSTMSDIYQLYYAWTILAISPTAILGDDISYYSILGEVVGTPAVTTSNGDSYDSIHVKYQSTHLFSMWGPGPVVNAYYEAASGLLIQIFEEYDNGIWKFFPGTISIVSGIPFSTTSMIVSLAVIGLIIIYLKKKR